MISTMASIAPRKRYLPPTCLLGISTQTVYSWVPSLRAPEPWDSGLTNPTTPSRRSTLPVSGGNDHIGPRTFEGVGRVGDSNGPFDTEFVQRDEPQDLLASFDPVVALFLHRSDHAGKWSFDRPEFKLDVRRVLLSLR